eukprot:724067-Pelagomonas_calceolata.AAC.1
MDSYTRTHLLLQLLQLGYVLLRAAVPAGQHAHAVQHRLQANGPLLVLGCTPGGSHLAVGAGVVGDAGTWRAATTCATQDTIPSSCGACKA